MLVQADSVEARISLAEDALAEAGAKVIALDCGRVIRQPPFPRVYDVNLVRRVRLRSERLDESLEQLAAPFLAIGARHLQLTLDGSDVPDSLAPLLRVRGFQQDRLVAMILDGPVEGARAPDVELWPVPDRASWALFADAMDRLNREEAWYARAVSLEIVGSLRKKHQPGKVGLYVGALDGRAVGTLGIAHHRGAASVFSVGTLPEARRRGVGRTMVLEAIARARSEGADLVYLIARADDSPREMYQKIGFRVELGFDVWLRLPR